MPRPTPRSYTPEHYGADCANCPLDCKGKLPVPPKRATSKAKAIVIGESPDYKSKFSGIAFQGDASRELVKALESAGLRETEVHFVYRLACTVPRNKRLDKDMRAASRACRERVVNELQRLDPNGKLPRLYLGKWAPMKIVGAREYDEAREIRLSQSVMRLGTMCLIHPNVAFRTKPAWRESYSEDLKRFARVAAGKLRWPSPWEGFIITPDKTALKAIKEMGTTVAVDVETTGIDPLTTRVTVIGLSDGVRTVSLPWCNYSNRHGDHRGIEHSQDPLHLEIKAALKATLESRRLVAHNGSYDLPLLHRLDIYPKTPMEDSLDASKILWPEIPANRSDLGHTRKTVGHRGLKNPLTSHITASKI